MQDASSVLASLPHRGIQCWLQTPLNVRHETNSLPIPHHRHALTTTSTASQRSLTCTYRSQSDV